MSSSSIIHTYLGVQYFSPILGLPFLVLVSLERHHIVNESVTSRTFFIPVIV